MKRRPKTERFVCIFSAALCALLWLVSVSGCGGGSSPNPTEPATQPLQPSVTAPSLSTIQEQLAVDNTYCMVSGLTLTPITLPVCERVNDAPDDLVYSVTGLPEWLAFDSSSRALSLNGVSTVPSGIDSVVSGTYGCVSASDSSLTASVAFSINDCDGDGLVDNWEYHYSNVPCISPNNGATKTQPGTLDLYPGCQSGIVVVSEGLNSRNSSDATADPDSDGCDNACEFANGTNPFIATSGATFSTKRSFSSITVPWHGVVSADFDKDGNLDLAVTGDQMTGGVDSLGVLLGNGDWTSRDNDSYAVAPQLGWSAPGYFDGDDIIDMVVIGSDKLYFFKGDGDGTFTQGSSLSISGGPDGISTADFNGDGRQDIVITEVAGNKISVLLSGGDGTFTEKANYATTYPPSGRVVTADFNEDSIPDIAITNYNAAISSSPVSVYLGIGDGTFGERQDYSAGDTPWGISSGDLNDDGHIDLVVAVFGYSQHITSINVLLGKGDGSFDPPVSYGSQAETLSDDPGNEIYENFIDVVVADLNGDAKLDLAATVQKTDYSDKDGVFCDPFTVNCTTLGYAVIFLGLGDGTFSDPVRTDGGEGGAGDILAGDFDNDGDLDLVISNIWANTLSILENK